MWAFLHTVAWSVCNIKTGIFPHHSVPLGGYVSVKSKLQHSPPTPTQAFDTFAVLGWGIWTAPSISCEISGMASYHWGRGIRGFSWKKLFLYGQLVTRKGLKQALCCIWRYLNFIFLILDTGFEYMNVLSCVYNEIEYLYWQFNATIKSSTEARENDRGQLLWPATCVLINKVRDNACQWNGHDVVISEGGIFFIQRFVCCMTHEENLLLNYFSFELMITWMDPSVGIWTAFWPRVGGNLNYNIINAWGVAWGGGGVVRLRFDWYNMYVPRLNFNTNYFALLRRKLCCCWYSTIVFVLFSVNILVSTHLCVVFHHFCCPMSLFQGHVAC